MPKLRSRRYPSCSLSLGRVRELREIAIADKGGRERKLRAGCAGWVFGARARMTDRGVLRVTER